MHLSNRSFNTHAYKTSITVISLEKHYMPGSHRVAVCFSDYGYTEYFDSYGLPPYKLESMACHRH